MLESTESRSSEKEWEWERSRRGTLNDLLLRSCFPITTTATFISAAAAVPVKADCRELDLFD